MSKRKGNLLVLTVACTGLFFIAVYRGENSTGWLSTLITWAASQAKVAEPFAPFATPTVALLVGAVAYVSYLKRREADSRAQWWQRVEKAIDLTLQDEKVGRNVGLVLLIELSKDRSTIPEYDRELLRNVVEPIFISTVKDNEQKNEAPEEDADEQSQPVVNGVTPDTEGTHAEFDSLPDAASVPPGSRWTRARNIVDRVCPRRRGR